MRCTKCSAPIRPVVAFDIDGTLGDYHGHFLKFAEQYLGRGRNGINYAGGRMFSDWFCKVYHTTLDEFRDIKLAYRQGAQKRSMPMYDGASDMVNEIASLDVEIWVTTTRPYLRLDNVDPDTREWLSRNNIPFDGLIYDEKKYQILADRIEANRVVAVLDDQINYVSEAGRMFIWKGVIWKRNIYNQAEGGPSLGESDPAKIAGIITGYVNDWKELHA